MSGLLQISGLDGKMHVVEMDVGAAAPGFFGDLGGHCSCESGMAPRLGARRG
jgi:hypothetical protein